MEVRPKLDPETCSICGRRLLQGEQVNYYVAPDSSRRVVCELCVPRAERVRWVREREGGEEVVQLRPSRGQRSGMFKRMGEFFGAGEPAETDSFADGGEQRPDQAKRRRARAARREGAAPLPPELDIEPRDVLAIPTEPESRLERGIELFNLSQFPRTIAGLSRSLGDPTEPVEQSGRGNDVDELAPVVSEWNAAADGFGRLFLASGAPAPADEVADAAPADSSDLGPRQNPAE